MESIYVDLSLTLEFSDKIKESEVKEVMENVMRAIKREIDCEGISPTTSLGTTKHVTIISELTGETVEEDF